MLFWLIKNTNLHIKSNNIMYRLNLYKMKNGKYRLIVSLIFLIIWSQVYGQLSDKTIYLEPQNSPKLQQLANDLKSYLEKIDGATHTISTNSFSGIGIVLAIADSSNIIAVSDKITLDALNFEGYLLDANASRVIICGRTALAVQQGMYDFLERIGCRFLAPSSDWTVIPENEIWSLSVKTFNDPDFTWRDIWYSNYQGEGYAPDNSLTEIAEDHHRFFNSTRQGGVAPIRIDHSFTDLHIIYADSFAVHPEWFGMKEDGTRWTPADIQWGVAYSYEYSDTTLANFLLKLRLEQYEQQVALDPFNVMVSMEPQDGSGQSYSPESLALGNKSDQVLYLANWVAKRLKAIHPEAIVAISLYANHLAPPLNVVAEDNIFAQMALAFNESGMSYNDIIQGWRDHGLQNISIYEYAAEMQWTAAMPADGKLTFDYISKAIPHFYNDWGITGMSVESSSYYGRMGAPTYLMRKLYWDANADAEQIYSEYFNVAFGAAAPQMRALFDLWETDEGAALTAINVGRWLDKMNEAFVAAQSEPAPIQKRLDDMAAYLHLTALYYEATISNCGGAGDTTEVKEKVGNLYKFAWRIRMREMVSFYPFWDYTSGILDEVLPEGWYTEEAATDPSFEEAWEWNIVNMLQGNCIWQENSDDYSSAEIRALINADHQQFNDHESLFEYTESLFPYNDNAPVLWEGVDDFYGCTGKSVWHIKIDEPGALKVNFKSTGVPLQGAVLQNEAGDTIFSNIASGFDEVAIDSLDIPVPAAGIYRLLLISYQNDPFNPVFNAPYKFVVEASEKHPLESTYFTPLYFLVPEGTDTLKIAYKTFLSIKAPSWAEQQEYSEDQCGILKIPVNGDFGIWSFEHVTASDIALLNVPPFLSTHVDNLLTVNRSTTATTTVYNDKMDFKVYPNPTSGTVHLVFPKNRQGVVVISDITGKPIFRQNINSAKADIDLNTLPNGIYLVSWRTAKNTITEKFILQR